VSPPCPTPVAWETLVAYWAADLDPDGQDALEAHLMACPACSAESERVAAITEPLRRALPPLLAPEQLAQLRHKGLRIRENPIAPGEVSRPRIGTDVDLFLHRLGGLELARAQRVSFEMRAEGTDRVMIAIDDAPFDRAGNAVLLACHAHYAELPHDVVVDVRARSDDGRESRATYTIHHVFV
jgi:anti-sigma factor RsiW